eukprot:Plantae.Rhodophyta-Purpureofilum_apyrenoidigerum.ctg92518.p2 GENE.Plantae.Rhodophyta-Purpureofilum_apyrenoidigerum.ctg92518~~Plantae.Rhodophyta-Purpureofilum_apyrenoidigerum.ctg92518.p2  ORF type:complete len:147 (+),score=10.18 Plantae.Rhodophyta-Purpureofilum_apyrenoidigerum.ctg92518:23-442(+)
MDFHDMDGVDLMYHFANTDESFEFEFQPVESLMNSKGTPVIESLAHVSVCFDSALEREREVEDLVGHMLLMSRQRLQGTTCPLCSRHFARDYDMRRHVRQTHGKIRPHKCEDCGKSFARNSHLQSHLANRHSVEKTNRK